MVRADALRRGAEGLVESATSTEGDLSNLPEFAAGNDKLVGNEGPDGLDGGPFSDDCEIDPNDLYRDYCEGIAFP